MGKSIIQEAKQNVKNNKKEINKVKNTQRKETIKTILITILITGIIAFIGGIAYESSNSDKVNAKAQALVEVVTPQLKQ